jgi:hypothetical protein
LEIIKMEKKIVYFDEPGPQNTDAVIAAVKERIIETEVKYVVVASTSGNTALKAAKALKALNVKVVCVTVYAGIKLAWPEYGKWPAKNIRKSLLQLGVKVLDETPWIFKGVTFDAQFLKRAAPSWATHEFISRTMGYGFKTALEVVLLAAEAGAVPINEEVVSIAGTGWLGGGADCAVIVRPSPVSKTTDVEKGLEVREIIAIPRVKFPDRLIKLIKSKEESV